MDPEVLKKAPLFAGLEDEAATALSSAMGSLHLNKGDVLFHEGDSEDRLYVVVSGKIKLGRSGSAGRENLLAVLGPGQMFGELSVFDPGPRSTTATAVTACELRTLEHDELIPWLTGRPEVAQGLLGQLAARLRRANDVVADLVFSDVPGRVAKQLLELAQRFGDKRDDGMHVHHDLTQEELAQLVGASRETVNKALADFAARGWIRLEPRSVTILDVERRGAPSPVARRNRLRVSARELGLCQNASPARARSRTGEMGVWYPARTFNLYGNEASQESSGSAEGHIDSLRRAAVTDEGHRDTRARRVVPSGSDQAIRCGRVKSLISVTTSPARRPAFSAGPPLTTSASGTPVEVGRSESEPLRLTRAARWSTCRS